MIYLLTISLLLSICNSLSPQPKPTCQSSKTIQSTIPITINETQLFNLDDYITGFNVQFTLTSSTPQFITLTNKTDIIKSFQIKQPGLKSHHLQHHLSTTTLITLSQNNSNTIIRWGISNTNSTIPQPTHQVILQNQTHLTCYDVAFIQHMQLAIVDCSVRDNVGGLTNIFLYINTTSEQILPNRTHNNLYAPFTRITRRTMLLLRQNGFNYLIRAYYGDSVDQRHNQNTYLQIMLFTNPLKPRTIKVMDRSFLHTDRLTITDFKLHMGNMYVLDYHSGVFVLDITPNQNIVITGRYITASGYLRIGIYSSNLDNNVLFALANHHSIYEVDFTDQIRPQIIRKYSIMSNASIHSLWVNEDYVIAQFSANVTTSTNRTVAYNPSIVFTRGSRTYLNAFQIFQHQSSNVMIQLSQNSSQILIMQQNYIRVYKINMPILKINPTNNNTLNNSYSFVVRGISVNSLSSQPPVTCFMNMKFVVVDFNSMSLWPTGQKLPQTYYANYPGQLVIFLDRYMQGPNITWGVHENKHPNMSAYWILQQNLTILHWDKHPSISTITFLRQEQFQSLRDTQIFIYIQDHLKFTYFLWCETVPYNIDAHCKSNGYISDVNSKISNLTANRWEQYGGRYIHLVAIVYEDQPNQILFYQGQTKRKMLQLNFTAAPYQGRVTNIQFVGHFLAVLQKYTKQIIFFDIRNCIDRYDAQCKQIYRINSLTMQRLGIYYFSPVDIYISDFHPFVLFIQNLDSVIILSITRNGPRLLTQIQSPGSKQPGIQKFKIAIAQNHLLIVNPPDLIQQHSLDELYSKRVAFFTKKYPIYNYQIPDKFDLDFSDAGNLVYITAIDKKIAPSMNSVILVYRTGYPSVSSFYDVFHINARYEEMLIDVTGVYADYVAVSYGAILHMFRQYSIPILVFSDSLNDFTFNLTYSNDPQNRQIYLSSSSVKISNIQQDLIVSNNSIKSSNFLTNIVQYENKKKIYTLNDSSWFSGNIVNYTFKGCQECGKKINVINHIQHKRNLQSIVQMDDYVFTMDGGIILQSQSLITMRHNGSINQFISIPSILLGQNCKYVTYSMLYNFAISACEYPDEVYLYIISLINQKPFVIGPFLSAAKQVANIQTLGQLIIVVDVPQQPSRLSQQGGVLIYSINHNINEPQLFDQIDIINTDDLLIAQGWHYGDTAFIANAHFVYTNQSELYRIAITEVRYGVFFVDFRWSRGMRELEIMKIQFLDLRQELIGIHMPMPNMAYFQAVTISSQTYDRIHKHWNVQLIITTHTFHNFQVNCFFDSTGTLVEHKIAKVFSGYGYYEVSNYIKTFDGYFAVLFQLPIFFYDFYWLSKQVVAVYDTRQRWIFTNQSSPTKWSSDPKIPTTYFLGGIPLDVGRVTFDFNFTFNRNPLDPFRDIGLLILNSRSMFIRQTAIHDYMAIVTQGGITTTQNAKLVVFNDYSQYILPLDLLIDNNGVLPGWAIALIAIGSVILIGVVGVIIWRVRILKRKQKPQEEVIKKSLLEDQADSKKPQDEQQGEQQQQDEQQQQGEQEQQVDKNKQGHHKEQDKQKKDIKTDVTPVESKQKLQPQANQLQEKQKTVPPVQESKPQIKA